MTRFLLIFFSSSAILTAQEPAITLSEKILPPKMTAGERIYLLSEENTGFSMWQEGRESEANQEAERTVVESEETVLAVDDAGRLLESEITFLRAYRIGVNGMTLFPWHGLTVVRKRQGDNWHLTVREGALPEAAFAELGTQLGDLEVDYELRKALFPEKAVAVDESWKVGPEGLRAVFTQMQDAEGTLDLERSSLAVKLAWAEENRIGLEIKGTLVSKHTNNGTPSTISLDIQSMEVFAVGPYRLLREVSEGIASFTLEKTSEGPGLRGRGLTNREAVSILLDEESDRERKAQAPRNSTRVLEAAGFESLANEIRSRVKNMNQGHVSTVLSREQRARFIDAIETSFSEERLRADMREILDFELTREREEKLLEWLESDRGKAVIERRRAFLDNDGEVALAWADGMDQEELAERLPAVGALLRERGTTETWLGVAVSIALHMTDLVNLLQPGVVDERERASLGPRIVANQGENMQLGTLVVYAYLLRDLSNEELAALREQASSDFGIWFRGLEETVIQYVLAKRFAEAAELVR